MKNGFFRRKVDAMLGVDISDSAIRLVELARSGSGYTVQGYAVQTLPARAVIDGALHDLEGIGQALYLALSKLRTSARQAAIAVAGASVITRVIELPTGLGDDEMARRVQLEADQYIPYALEEVALDFQVQGPSAQDATRVEVLLAACLKEQVEVREAVLAFAGLVPRVIDVEGFALARACRQDFASFTPGYQVDGAQWVVDAPGMGIACGLALRSFTG
ncbi:pilus assembly protein [Pseudomonas fluorescens ABAC62]|nr:pilus assembly protein [Pseudomonas fluorescens ABAC62]